MVKRLIDFFASAMGLVVVSPIMLPVMLLVWLQDRHSPFYIADRVGYRGKNFRMVKLRSMVINADKSGVDSTAANDRRITAVGHFIRRFKLDELSQLWNVLTGDMSLVGPRPNVASEVDRYTEEERGLLEAKPGITDISSIIFSDEGDILRDSADPDLDYNRLIRPWKSRTGLFYVEKQNLALDLALIALTVIAIVSKQRALSILTVLMRRLDAPDELIAVAARKNELTPHAPPGADRPVVAADLGHG
jgi:lipopolysaccharide/colanic/teichoic acid biosynthesis glycosyltransferase